MRITVEYYREYGRLYKITTFWLLGFIPVYSKKERMGELL